MQWVIEWKGVLPTRKYIHILNCSLDILVEMKLYLIQTCYCRSFLIYSMLMIKFGKSEKTGLSDFVFQTIRFLQFQNRNRERVK
jgi:hypothetical protein